MEKAGLMQNSFRVVITGSIASGKSTVSEYIRNKGFTVIDSDSVAKDILKSSDIDFMVNKKFGFSSQSDDFKREIFINKELRKFVEDNVYSILYDSYVNISGDIVFFEIPLYFESIEFAMRSGFVPNLVLYVSAERDVRHFRMKKFRNMSDDEIISRERHFLDENFKIENSDYIIYNNEDTDKLYLDTEKFLNENIKKTD